MEHPAGTALADGRPPQQDRRRSRWLFGAGLVMAVLAGAAVAAVFALVRSPGSQSLRPSGIPASITDSQVNLMGLSPVQASPAPGFTLTDQAGRTLSLADLRGKVVVLEFMDPHCTDICPLVSREFIDAYRDLGASAPHVVFLAVNVNRYHLQVADVAAFSSEQQLTAIPAWHFLTGPVASLQAVWKAYHVYVQAPGPNADIVHTSVVYFIDPGGKERFAASPMADHTQNGTAYLPLAEQAAWGHGLALIARQLAR